MRKLLISVLVLVGFAWPKDNSIPVKVTIIQSQQTEQDMNRAVCHANTVSSGSTSSTTTRCREVVLPFTYTEAIISGGSPTYSEIVHYRLLSKSSLFRGLPREAFLPGTYDARADRGNLTIVYFDRKIKVKIVGTFPDPAPAQAGSALSPSNSPAVVMPADTVRNPASLAVYVLESTNSTLAEAVRSETDCNSLRKTYMDVADIAPDWWLAWVKDERGIYEVTIGSLSAHAHQNLGTDVPSAVKRACEIITGVLPATLVANQ